ncbi:MAG: Fe-S cluster assembly protein IscX [Nitrospirales bacterium]
MAQDLMWTDTEDIGIRLQEDHPDLDPLTVRFTDLHAWVVGLPEFKDDPKASNEKKLEAIQMAWHEEYLDAKEEQR